MKGVAEGVERMEAGRSKRAVLSQGDHRACPVILDWVLTPMKIDLFEFARLGDQASGRIALADMRRVDTPDRAGALKWKAATGAGGRRGLPKLDLEIDGAIELICQRCLQPMTHAVAIRSHFVIAPDEESATVFDDDDAVDAIVGAADFDLDALLEDEVILSLPIAPRHEACPGGQGDRPAADEKPSPFAALAGLRTAKREGDDRDG